MSEATREDAFLAVFLKDKLVESRGGYVFEFLVPFDDVEKARAICGGAYKPDDPMTMGVTRIGRIAAKASD